MNIDHQTAEVSTQITKITGGIYRRQIKYCFPYQ